MATTKTLNTFLQWWKRKMNCNEVNDPPESNSEQSGSSSQSRILDIERAERAKRADLIQRAERLCTSQKTNSNAVLERLVFSVQHDNLPSPQPTSSPRRRPESSLRGRRIRPIFEEDNGGQTSRTQHDNFPSPQPTSSPRKRPESSLRGRRIRPIFEVDNGGQTSRTNQWLEEEDPFFERKLHLGSQMAILACKVAKMTATNRSQSPQSTLSSVDMHTPSELRAISQMDCFTPTPPPPAPTRKPSRLPVLSIKQGGAGKEVADGCKLQTAQSTFEELVKTPENFQLVQHPSPQQPAAPRRTPAVAPKVPAPPLKAALPNRREPCRRTVAVTPKDPVPPSTTAPPTRKGPCRGTMVVTPKVPAPPSTVAPPRIKGPRRGTVAVTPKVPAPPSTAAPPNRKGPRRGTMVVTPKVPAPPSTVAPPRIKGPRRGTVAVTPKVPAPPSRATPPNRKGPRRGTKLCPKKAVTGQEDLKPLVKPAESLSLCFKQLSSDDWEKKIEGLKSIRALARHHPALLQTKLHEVCLLLAEEVNNLRSAVACAAMNTVAELHVSLGRAMDPEAERTGRPLLLKLAQTTNAFIHQQANLALDALVESCSPGRIMNIFLNTGLSHLCAAVRGSAAQHLHQLMVIIGEDQILTTGKIFAERFLTAVSKMGVDAAPEVRHHGLKMLEGLAHQKGFTALWDKVIPVKDRNSLQKMLQKMRQ